MVAGWASQGYRVLVPVMITADDARTGAAIAKRVGILDGDEGC
jgi:cation transport ATPase